MTDRVHEPSPGYAGKRAESLEIALAKPDQDSKGVSELLRFYTELNRAKLDGRTFRGSFTTQMEDEFRRLDAEIACWEAFYFPPSGAMLVARFEDQIVGCVALREKNDTTVEIKRLYVIPDCRGKGVARRLMLDAVRISRHRGYRKAALECFRDWVEPVALYSKFGFKETDPDRAAGAHPLLSMEVDL